MERLWSCHLGDRITIPRTHILSASDQRPATGWRELRSPGTYLPGVIKAGTYYTERGREFWYCTGQDHPVLALDLEALEYYKRIVIDWPDQPEAAAIATALLS